MSGLIHDFVPPDEALCLYRLLAYCARARCEEPHHRQITQKASEITQWQEALDLAEMNGLAPLLYTHLQEANAPFPDAVKRALQGLYLRHRQVNQVRTAILGDILTAYDAAGIKALVLKGAALAHLVYPQPGLRPMRDIDFLVEESAARRAQQILADLGFHAPLHDIETKITLHHHLKPAVLDTGSLSISVEIHYRFFKDDHPGPMYLHDLTAIPQPFSLGTGITAYTLGHEDMLWHLCRHMLDNATVFYPTRLVWVADIVSYAEYFADAIDWGKLRRQYPVVLNTLSLLHFLTPLSDALRNQASLSLIRTPQGIGAEFQGWPRSALAAQRHKGYFRILHDTFFPSEWWLRLNYGLGSDQPLWWHRWVRHPLDILGWVKQLLGERLEMAFAKEEKVLQR
jgi:hypothetical protein